MRNPETIARARRFRKAPTKTEDMLWQRLRRNQLEGMQFRRQADIGNLVVDFACKSAGLVVEVDGGVHNFPDVKARDEARDHHLRLAGFTVLRFSAEAVESEIEAVLFMIKRALKSPSPVYGGGVGEGVLQQPPTSSQSAFRSSTPSPSPSPVNGRGENADV